MIRHLQLVFICGKDLLFSAKIYNFIGFMYIISRLFCKNGNSNKSKNASVRLLFFHSLSAMFT